MNSVAVDSGNSAAHEFNSKSIWFHEDDFCQIEFQPKENLKALIKDCKEISEQSTNGSKSNPSTKVRTSDRGIKTFDLISLFERNNFQVNKEVYSGSISHPRRATDAMAFKKDTITFYCRFKDDLVKNIFIDVNIPPKPINEYKVMLKTLGKQWDLLLVDWQQLAVVELDNELQLDNYLTTKYKSR